MSGILMMVIAIVVLGGAYLLYGRYLQNKWGIDPNAKTPAYEIEDGVDYVPADTNVVFGHQFASIAVSYTHLKCVEIVALHDHVVKLKEGKTLFHTLLVALSCKHTVY